MLATQKDKYIDYQLHIRIEGTEMPIAINVPYEIAAHIMFSSSVEKKVIDEKIMLYIKKELRPAKRRALTTRMQFEDGVYFTIGSRSNAKIYIYDKNKAQIFSGKDARLDVLLSDDGLYCVNAPRHFFVPFTVITIL